jgi:spore coat protein U-like protein
MIKLVKIGVCGLATGMLLAANVSKAQANTATGTIAVSATVLSFCAVVTLPLAFGNYSQAALNATTTLTVTCTSGTTYNVGLDTGIGTGATVAARKMSYLTNTLTYGLYSDSGHSVVWGNTIGTNTIAGTGTGLVQTLTVYGQIPASQTVAPGAYVDTVTATVTY